MSESDLVWAVHDDVEIAARIGRNSPELGTGWREVDADHPKVAAALHRPFDESNAPTPAESGDDTPDTPVLTEQPATTEPAGSAADLESEQL